MGFLLAMFTKETHHAFEILKISAALVLFGIPAYFFIEMFYETEYITLRRALLARIRHHFHAIPKPRSAYKKILSYTGPYNKNTVIIDSNSPLGVISHLIHKKGRLYKKHHIFCSSKEERKFLHYIIKKQEREHLVDIHKIKTGSIPLAVKRANVFISHNDLGYVKDMSRYLKKIEKVLPKGAKYCFYVTHHFLDVAPNSNLLENKEALLSKFTKAGFSKTPRYVVTKHFFKKDIFIYGVK